jgi:alkanesulfonate monooxygenase SsuD/methylene tetrahydromethanopterin reductase-like flavin-dependent oxidoreductase (luciferase family)
MICGVGLWTMRATRSLPGSPAALYRDLIEDARLADALGFHSLWIAEHHFWYDGWCPAPMTAAGAVLGATSQLHVGTGILQLPLQDPLHTGDDAEMLQLLSGGRFELGVGLGYRDAEFDAFGLARADRGRRMSAALETLSQRWADGAGQGPQVWVGGFAEVSIRRAASLGLGLLLPTTVSPAQIRAAIELGRSAALEAGRTLGPVGVIKHAWATDGTPRQALEAGDAIAASIREYTGAWFPLKGQPAFEVPELLERQVRRAVDAGLIGPPEQLVADLRELEGAGIDLVVLQLTSDGVRVDHRANMSLIAAEVLPSLEDHPA